MKCQSFTDIGKVHIGSRVTGIGAKRSFKRNRDIVVNSDMERDWRAVEDLVHDPGGRDRHLCRSTSGQSAVANINERHATAGGAFVLQLTGLDGPRSRSDDSRLEAGKEGKEEQSSDSEHKEAENLLHTATCAFSSWCREGASVEEAACISGASGFS
jgi:hypothetical protein